MYTQTFGVHTVTLLFTCLVQHLKNLMIDSDVSSDGPGDCVSDEVTLPDSGTNRNEGGVDKIGDDDSWDHFSVDHSVLPTCASIADMIAGLVEEGMYGCCFLILEHLSTLLYCMELCISVIAVLHMPVLQ